VKVIDLVLPDDRTEITTGQMPWLILELMADNLAGYMMKTELTVQNVHAVLLQVCNGIEHMHSQNVTHRDLKLENILIRDDDVGITAKISDLGQSKHKVNEMNTLSGTATYMAPELVALSEPGLVQKYSKSVDMWSLGIITLELLTERLKADWDLSFLPTKADYLTWVQKSVLFSIDQANKEFQPLLRALLCVDPAERWTAQQARAWLETLNINKRRKK
jgi:serine/threonine protein kinase